jgi:hypothetical protein
MEVLAEVAVVAELVQTLTLEHNQVQVVRAVQDVVLYTTKGEIK